MDETDLEGCFDFIMESVQTDARLILRTNKKRLDVSMPKHDPPEERLSRQSRLTFLARTALFGTHDQNSGVVL